MTQRLLAGDPAMAIRPWALTALFTLPVATMAAPSGSAALTPQWAPGQEFGTVFSIMRSIKAPGFDEFAARNGGSADYTVTTIQRDSVQLRVAYRYDGRAAGNGEVEVRDAGRTACTLKANSAPDCQPALDASGLLYNPLLWGVPPGKLAAHLSWKVDIAPAWELGGAHGSEQVTVIRVDPETDTVVLMREGNAEGLFGEGEATQRQLSRSGQTETLELLPGRAHWKGYTTITKGIIFSDELLVTRESQLRTQSGELIPASERWIMLLNAAPYPTLS
jgi:hypothetical protein